jgi:hypothetical protein
VCFFGLVTIRDMEGARIDVNPASRM